MRDRNAALPVPAANSPATKASGPRQIEQWPLDRLKPYSRNARTHSPEQIAQIAASIQEFGFTNPILVASDDGILAGHGRLAAAKDLKLQEVPVVVLDHLTPKQRRAYVLADNKLALNAGWDDSLLSEEITALHLQDFDLSVLGWSEDVIAGILDPEGIGNAEAPKDFPEVGDDIETDHRCPSCGYEWSGKTK